MLRLSRRLVLVASLATVVSACGSSANGTEAIGDGIVVEEAGLAVPESVLYDEASDAYIVSNISGSPGAVDGDGFLSRIGPGGDVISVRFVDGLSPETELSAPKGMAIVSGELWVTDVTVIRRFDRSSGLALGEVEVPGAEFLNDLAERGGVAYVSDTAVGTVHRIDGDTVERIYEGAVAPNGLAVDGDGVLWAVSGDTLHAIEDGAATRSVVLPTGRLDGLVLRDDGRALISSWDGECVYQGPMAGPFEVAIGGLSSPADIGWDDSRERVLVPLFEEDALRFEFVP